MACPASAPCLNLGFESGTLAGWAASGDVNVIGKLGDTSAPEGSFMLEVSNAGAGVGMATFETCPPKTAKGLLFRWRLYSEEFQEYCGSTYEDYFEASVKTSAGTTAGDMKRTISQLCQNGTVDGQGSKCTSCGTYYAGLEKSDIQLDQGDTWRTPWQDAAVPLTGLNGNLSVTLTFEVASAGDAIFNTLVLIDYVRFGDLPPCVASCNLKPVCGDDGCGGQCGGCPDGCSCTPAAACANGDGTPCTVPPPVCGATCANDKDCPAAASGQTIVCGADGLCHDSTGSCDGTNTCCRAGQQCLDLMSMIRGGLTGGGLPVIPGQPAGGGAGYCGPCETSDDCMGGLPCSDMSAVCAIPIIGQLFCPGGAPSASVPTKMCADLTTLLSGLGGI